ncbi:DNA polymerase beta superfamily protein [Taibaiella koreensis]|uniref:DNA polymerase beta superfamily protein n=1 Tax=Taibaiella koreensis TaxID=1268548 RepID=UPI000E59A960|nr:nucleotidyltransferase domain-containing protein [Taibaiella koreensis]
MTIAEIKDKGLLLLECISGSRAYGLDTPSSDTDIKGVFYLPRDQFYGLHYVAQVSNETNDEVYYELGRFVELLLRNNPNMLELLATPDDLVLYRHPLMAAFTQELFLSRLCRDTFAGYAYTQIKKARGYNKKASNPVAPERKHVIDCCFVTEGHQSFPLEAWLQARGYRQEDCGLVAMPHTKGLYALYHSPGAGYRGIVSAADANEVCLSSIPKGEEPESYLYFNQESYSAHCREYREYWGWVALRNEERYLGNKAHGKDYDAKNMMHTIRLLQVAEELLRSGTLQVRRHNREDLLAIKNGEYDYEALLDKAEALMKTIAAAAKDSPLPAEPDEKKAVALLVSLRQQLYT